MLLTILLIAAAVGVLLATGHPPAEMASLCGIVFAYSWVYPRLDRWIELRTGRTSMNPTELYTAVELVVMMLISIPPLFFFPGVYYLVTFFTLLGLTVGSAVAQAYLGKIAT